MRFGIWLEGDDFTCNDICIADRDDQEMDVTIVDLLKRIVRSFLLQRSWNKLSSSSNCATSAYLTQEKPSSLSIGF